MKDSNETQEKLTLLLSANLKSTNSQSTTLTQEFSETNYWSEETVYPYNLNNYKVSSRKKTEVISIVKEYGKNKNAEGRLMTIEEARRLNKEQNNQKWLYSSNYWLGSAENTTEVWYINGETNNIFKQRL